MPLAGHAFLALWNDIAREREAEYDRWHTLEHVPERVSVRGFHGARRYVNRRRDDHRYFTLYDVDSLAVFETREYRDLLDHPTPWSAAMRPDFANFVRAICALTLTRGTGIGAAIACLGIPRSVDDVAIHGALAGALDAPGVTGVHAGRRTEGAPVVPFGAPPPRTADERAFDRVALIEALDDAAAGVALDGVQRALGLSLPRDFAADVYTLAFVFPGADPAEREHHRRPAWAANRE